MAKTNAQINIGVNLTTDNLSAQANQIQNFLNRLKLPPELKKNFDEVFNNFGKELSNYQNKLNQGFKTKGDITGLAKSGAELEKYSIQIDKLMKSLANSPTVDLEKIFPIDENIKNKIETVDKEIEKLKATLDTELNNNNFLQEAKDILSKGFKTEGAKKAAKEISEAFSSGDIEKAAQRIKEAVEKQYSVLNINQGRNTENIKANIASFERLQIILQNLDISNIQQFEQDINKLDEQKARLIAENIEKINDSCVKGTSSTKQFSESIKNTVSQSKEAAIAQQQMSSEIEQLGSRVKHFFSLTNSVMLLRRALRDVINTVKELDAVMTETAVVTNFNVGDMWSQLPEYTERANKLGVAIKSVYESSTLYYQQGLKTNEVVALSNETLKMARIAGMEASDATDRRQNRHAA